VVLTIQYLGPLLILVWLAVWLRRRLPRGLWGAAVLSALGCFFVVRAHDIGRLDPLGLAAAAGAALTFAIYLVTSERAGRRYEPVTTLMWGFGFASLFWAVVQPLWSFPFARFESVDNIALGLASSSSARCSRSSAWSPPCVTSRRRAPRSWRRWSRSWGR
jgi:drug/metabolite transporter (DMT)-like permease